MYAGMIKEFFVNDIFERGKELFSSLVLIAPDTALKMKMNSILMAVFKCIIVACIALERRSCGAYFVEVTRYNKIIETEDQLKLDFNQHLHRCLSKTTCNNIASCKKAQNVLFYAREIDVLLHQQHIRVWRKILPY